MWHDGANVPLVWVDHSECCFLMLAMWKSELHISYEKIKRWKELETVLRFPNLGFHKNHSLYIKKKLSNTPLENFPTKHKIPVECGDYCSIMVLQTGPLTLWYRMPKMKLY